MKWNQKVKIVLLGQRLKQQTPVKLKVILMVTKVREVKRKKRGNSNKQQKDKIDLIKNRRGRIKKRREIEVRKEKRVGD